MTTLNVLGVPLLACSYAPLSGFSRDGCCHSDENDHGTHVVCAKITSDFLTYCGQPADLVLADIVLNARYGV